MTNGTKVLCTNTFFSGKELNRLRNVGYTGTHNQFRLICKCKSMADGNRKVELLTGNEKTFTSGWCSETGNKKELELCKKEDVWVAVDSIGGDYISMTKLLEDCDEETPVS